MDARQAGAKATVKHDRDAAFPQRRGVRAYRYLPASRATLACRFSASDITLSLADPVACRRPSYAATTSRTRAGPCEESPGRTKPAVGR